MQQASGSPGVPTRSTRTLVKQSGLLLLRDYVAPKGSLICPQRNDNFSNFISQPAVVEGLKGQLCLFRNANTAMDSDAASSTGSEDYAK